MSRFKKAMGYLGMADIETPPSEAEAVAHPESEANSVSFDSDTSVAGFSIHSPSPSPSPYSSFRSQGGSMNRISTLCPKTYEDAPAVGKAIREGIPVVLNLSEVADEKTAYRIFDFSSGVIFALQGSIARVTPKVFILSPAQVSLDGTQNKNANNDPFAN
ncbi:MAG: cell division protein SepF [Aeriscardovia sp.]|nr:cell division protein SepF [Aeriscardovia sp.]MBQ1427879.1 cell division protein SepF [Aeriscardovia sp.]